MQVSVICLADVDRAFLLVQNPFTLVLRVEVCLVIKKHPSTVNGDPLLWLSTTTIFICRLEQILASVSDPYEKAYKLLTQWKNQAGHGATQQALADLLRDAASAGLISADVADAVSGPPSGLQLLGLLTQIL